MHLLINILLSLVPVFLFLAVLVLLDSFKLLRLRSILLTIGVGSGVAIVSFFINSRLIDLLALLLRGASVGNDILDRNHAGPERGRGRIHPRSHDGENHRSRSWNRLLGNHNPAQDKAKGDTEKSNHASPRQKKRKRSPDPREILTIPERGAQGFEIRESFPGVGWC